MRRMSEGRESLRKTTLCDSGELRIRPKLPQMPQSCPGSWPMSALASPRFASFGQSLADFGPSKSIMAKCWPKLGQNGPETAQQGRTSVETGQILAESMPMSAFVAQFWSNSGNFGGSRDKLRPTLGQVMPKSKHVRSTSSNFADSKQVVAEIMPKPEPHRTMLVEIGQTWHGRRRPSSR